MLCFCVLLWGHYRCALLICDLKKMFRHQNLVLTVWSGWQVWIKRTALICCRNGLKVCARKCSCAGKMNSLRPAWCCWNATLTKLLTVFIDHWLTTIQRQILVGLLYFLPCCEVVITDVCSDTDCSQMSKSSFLHQCLSILYTCSFLETVLIEGAESKLDNL